MNTLQPIFVQGVALNAKGVRKSTGITCDLVTICSGAATIGMPRLSSLITCLTGDQRSNQEIESQRSDMPDDKPHPDRRMHLNSGDGPVDVAFTLSVMMS